jgi:hypothetical protein
MKTYLTTQGTNLRGDPSYWLDLDDDEDADALLNAGTLSDYQYRKHEEDGHIAGFFNSKEEAQAYAVKNGWTITNE